MNIQIVGSTGEGKTTLAYLIYQHLTNEGFEVSIIDSDRCPNNMDDLINSIQDKEVPLAISTLQSLRP